MHGALAALREKLAAEASKVVTVQAAARVQSAQVRSTFAAPFWMIGRSLVSMAGYSAACRAGGVAGFPGRIPGGQSVRAGGRSVLLCSAGGPPSNGHELLLASHEREPPRLMHRIAMQDEGVRELQAELQFAKAQAKNRQADKRRLQEELDACACDSTIHFS